MIQNFNAKTLNFCLDKNMGAEQIIAYFGMKGEEELKHEVNRVYRYRESDRNRITRRIEKNSKINKKAKKEKKVKNNVKNNVEDVNLNIEEIEEIVPINNNVESSKSEDVLDTLTINLENVVKEICYFESEKKKLFSQKHNAITKLSEVYDKLHEIENIVTSYKKQAEEFGIIIADANEKIAENSEFLKLCKDEKNSIEEQIEKYKKYSLVCDSIEDISSDGKLKDFEFEKEVVIKKIDELLCNPEICKHAEELKAKSLKKVAEILVCISIIEKDFENRQIQLVFEKDSEISRFLADIMKCKCVIKEK